MWISKEKYTNLLSDIKALTALLKRKEEECAQLFQAHASSGAIINELNQAKNGLISLAKARKVQILELGAEPIGLDEIAELQQEVLSVHFDNIVRRLEALEILAGTEIKNETGITEHDED